MPAENTQFGTPKREAEEKNGLIQHTLNSILDYLEQADWFGYDPYDALNGPILARISLGRPLVGAALTQFLRFLPVNPRSVLGIPVVRMTKTVSLIVQAHLNLARLGQRSQWHFEQARKGLEWLASQQICGFHGACWGYSHDWQARSMLLPKTQPSLVCTAFVARAFLSAYEDLGERRYLEIARSSCDFVLRDLPRYRSGDTYCFSYVPFDVVLAHNANLLGAELLARVYRHTREPALLENAMPALHFTLNDQHPDGGWFYDVHTDNGLNRTWIDNFHTGFVIESLLRFVGNTGYDLQRSLRTGLQYYSERFFALDGRPRRSSQSDYPVDLRDCTQAIIVAGLVDPPHEYPRLCRVLDWTLRHMRLRSGLIAYQRWPVGLNPVVYLRFQAWFLYGISCALVSEKVTHLWGR